MWCYKTGHQNDIELSIFPNFLVWIVHQDNQILYGENNLNRKILAKKAKHD